MLDDFLAIRSVPRHSFVKYDNLSRAAEYGVASKPSEQTR